MNISITDGYVTVDGTTKVSASHKLFTKAGIDIFMPKEKQPDRRPCDKCRQWHDPDLICHQPKENRTMGRLDIATLLESLAKRFAAGDSQWLSAIFLAEKENWK